MNNTKLKTLSMKKYLQLSALCLVVLAAGIFSSCKDDESGSSSPLIGMSVQLAAADSTVSTRINIDHANRLVTVSLSQEARDLSHVLCTFDLVNGASLYTPSVTNPVEMDLSDVTGVNILTGDNIVCYKIVAEVDSPIKEVKASYGGVEAVTSLDKKSRLINAGSGGIRDFGDLVDGRSYEHESNDGSVGRYDLCEGSERPGGYGHLQDDLLERSFGQLSVG